jgi:8-oxo-dGTP pyrophosphatase MutT (NUDIX family)
MHTEALERLRRRLAELQSAEPDDAQLEAAFPGARRAAVLALFYPRHDEPHLVLTRRTAHLSSHSGQISFPGGRIDPLDFSAAEAALRETREELGVSTDGLELYGPLMDRFDPPEPYYVAASNSLLLPFVAFADARPAFTPNPAEVAEIIELPFSHLLDPASIQDEMWPLRGEWRRIGFYRFGEHKIWGATGRVLRQIVALAGGPPPPPDLVPPGAVEPEAFPAERRF